MQLVFIHGPAGCGKLTVATALAAQSGFRLFHNHLTVDLALALFDFGSDPFVRLRESVWMEAFREAAREGQSLVFTFHPEATVRGDFPERVVAEVEALGGEVVFVELVCPDAVIEDRIERESRAQYRKLRSWDAYQELRDAGAFDFPPLPAPRVTIDTGTASPEDAARRILAQLDAASD